MTTKPLLRFAEGDNKSNSSETLYLCSLQAKANCWRSLSGFPVFVNRRGVQRKVKMNRTKTSTNSPDLSNRSVTSPFSHVPPKLRRRPQLRRTVSPTLAWQHYCVYRTPLLLALRRVSLLVQLTLLSAKAIAPILPAWRCRSRAFPNTSTPTQLSDADGNGLKENSSLEYKLPH